MHDFDINRGVWDDIPRPAQFGVGFLGRRLRQHGRTD